MINGNKKEKKNKKKKQEIEFFLQSIDKFATIQKSLWPNFNVKDFTDTLNKDIQQYFSDFKLGKKSAVDIVNIIGSKLNYCTKPFYL